MKGGEVMTWKERWEDFKETLMHPTKDLEREEEKSRHTHQHERREEALHRADRSTGSETLDD